MICTRLRPCPAGRARTCSPTWRKLLTHAPGCCGPPGRAGSAWQYPSEQARADAIDAGARRPPAVIRAGLDRAVQDCVAAIREHPRDLWDAPAIWLGAGRRPVRGVVTSLRRELEYHHVDLAAGYQPANWPDDFAATELSRATSLMNRRADAPPMTLSPPTALHIGTSPPFDIPAPRRRCWPGCLVAVTAAACTRTLRPCRPSRHWPSPAASPSGHLTGRCPPPRKQPSRFRALRSEGTRCVDARSGG